MIVILMGVSGTGKTTVGALLAKAIGASLCDADELHPADNIAKMARREPLTDDDRAPWLQRVKARIDAANRSKESLVVACSALKRSYRRLLRIDEGNPRFVYLHGTQALISERMRARQGHFMQAALLDSQFEALEVPQSDEALAVDIAAPPAEIVAQIGQWLKLA
jgi:carbohydrate kinase (thermoresistant glucokinase family)